MESCVNDWWFHLFQVMSKLEIYTKYRDISMICKFKMLPIWCEAARSVLTSKRMDTNPLSVYLGFFQHHFKESAAYFVHFLMISLILAPVRLF